MLFMTKKLYRSKKDSIIAGVCGGIAEYFEIDPTLVRLLTVLVVFLGGAGGIAYIIAWIIIPQNPEQITESEEAEEEKDNAGVFHPKGGSDDKRHIWGGLILILLGLFFLAKSLFPSFVFVRFWPLILVVTGFILIIQSLSRKK
jgi:phage shock protein C